ncbi:MAG TPA: hypothetical protein VK988_05595 [Acidimicrobiales bacterium]|nr:hypothetical protein [Acidimicrobiales bacterium]
MSDDAKATEDDGRRRRRKLKVSEYRRGRNFIRVGDVVRVKALPGNRNGFEAKVRAITIDERTGEPVEVEVFGGARGQGMVRTFRAERIERMAQMRRGERRERAR